MTEPNDTYLNNNGKRVEVYVIDANSLEEARSSIPGDYKVVYSYEDRNIFTIEIVRTF